MTLILSGNIGQFHYSATDLNKKLGTVQGYIKDVVYKLGCSSQYEIPEIAIKHGLAYLID